MALFAAMMTLAVLGGCGLIGGSSMEIARQLNGLEPGSKVELAPGTTLTVSHSRFDRVVIKAEGEGFVAIGTLDLDGRLELPGAPPFDVSVLGRERIPFEIRRGTPRPVPSLFPTLGAVAALAPTRLACLRDGCPGGWEGLVAAAWQDPEEERAALLARLETRAPQPEYRPTRWLIRMDRDRVELLEETASGASRRSILVPEQGQLRYASGNP